MTAPLGYSVRDTALLLSISQKTVRRMLADGRLDHVRIGRRVVVTAASVAVLLAGRTLTTCSCQQFGRGATDEG